MVKELVERLVGLRQYEQDGRRYPQKPLLALMALGRLSSSGDSSIPWSVAEEKLAALIAEFAPPSSTGTAQRAAYPFTRLRSDGVWVLSADVPMDAVSPLREQAVIGRLAPALEATLTADPGLLHATARRIVERQFPTTLVDDVLLACGLDPELALNGVAGPPLAERKVRSAAWREAIMLAWNNSCAFCGFDGAMMGRAAGIEAAHVRWFNLGGVDAPDNGLALCSLHHKLFDKGALGLVGERVVVSSVFTANTDAGRGVYELHDVTLRPRPGTVLPSASNVEWHATQVFKGQMLPI